MIQIIPVIIFLGNAVLIVYSGYSIYTISMDLKKQTQYYLNKGYSQEEAVALAFQDEAVEILMQIVTPPEGKVTIKFAEKFLLNSEIAKLIVKVSVEIAKEVVVKAKHEVLKSSDIKNTAIEIEKTLYDEVKDLFVDFPHVNVVDKITIPPDVQKAIDDYNGQQPTPHPSAPTPQAPTEIAPAISQPLDIPAYDAQSRLDNLLQKGKTLSDSIDEHNQLTPEELGKQAADIFQEIYNPQTPAEQQTMTNDFQKIGTLKNISEHEMQRVIAQKGAEIRTENIQLKAQGLPTKDLKDVMGESIDELLKTDHNIEIGKQIAKSLNPKEPLFPEDSGLRAYPSSSTSSSIDPTTTSTTDIAPEDIFTQLTHKFMDWFKEAAKTTAESFLLDLLSKLGQGNSPVPVPTPSSGITSGGGDVHVKGYDRNGHRVKPYDRSRPCS